MEEKKTIAPKTRAPRVSPKVEETITPQINNELEVETTPQLEDEILLEESTPQVENFSPKIERTMEGQAINLVQNISDFLNRMYS